jgi:hypothetical protein
MAGSTAMTVSTINYFALRTPHTNGAGATKRLRTIGIVVEIGQSITGNNANLADFITSNNPEFDSLENNSNRANQGKEVDPGRFHRQLLRALYPSC